jgi:hypothetical protein
LTWTLFPLFEVGDQLRLGIIDAFPELVEFEFAGLTRLQQLAIGEQLVTLIDLFLADEIVEFR